jgi:hypothetical protein
MEGQKNTMNGKTDVRFFFMAYTFLCYHKCEKIEYTQTTLYFQNTELEKTFLSFTKVTNSIQNLQSEQKIGQTTSE